MDESMIYTIRIKGHLDPTWSDWFDGMQIAHEPDEVTLLQGAVADQAALHGLLAKVGDLGLPLLSVTRSNQPESSMHTSDVTL